MNKNIAGHFCLVDTTGAFETPRERMEIFRQLEDIYGIEGVRGVEGYFHGTYFELKEGWVTLVETDERELVELVVYFGVDDYLVIRKDFSLVTPILEDIMYASEFSAIVDEESGFTYGGEK